MDVNTYQERCESFSWDDYRDRCDWDARTDLNMGHEVIDPRADDDEVAMHWRGADGETETWTFADLARESNRFANVLGDLGVEREQRLFTYLPRVPEHYAIILGTLKAGAVFGAINERYGPDGIEHRLADSGASVVVTTPDNRDVVAEAAADLDSLDRVVVVDRAGAGVDDGDVDYHARCSAASPSYDPVETGPEDPALHYYTSGTTGPAKGVVHPHRFIVALPAFIQVTGDIRADDVYWNTADPGWLTGLSTLGGWFLGATAIVYEGEFDPVAWAEILDDYPITVFGSVPTAYRMLREHESVLDDVDLDVRTMTSIGEPLNPGVVEWAEERFGAPVLDTYGTSETCGTVVANYPFEDWDVEPGSMGKPFPGVEIKLVEPGTTTEVETGEVGEIAVGEFPGVFSEYWNRPEQTTDKFVDGWALTDDLATRDEDGYLWFQGRADDVILSAGYRIGPFDVESELIDHEAVAEAAVVPEPDDQRGNVVKAFVVLSDGAAPTDETRESIRSLVRDRLAAHEYPREIEFVDALPKTMTGKIRRTELRSD
ncbi:MAG: acyl-CoA synthetase [Haloarculaceae archaeon]